MNRKLLIGVGILGSLLWGSAANAVDVTIGMCEAGCPVITTVSGPTANTATFTGAFGTFSSNTVVGNAGTAVAPPTIFSTLTFDTSTTVAGTLQIWASATGITSPTGLLTFLSGFTSNVLPTGWTVTEKTFIDPANVVFSTAIPLSSQLFATTGGVTKTASADTGAGPFSATEEFILVATGAGSASSTITLLVSGAPGPTVGGGLPSLAVACGGFLLWWRRRERSA